MNRTNEITLLPNPAFHTMVHNGYIKLGTFLINNLERNIVLINYNKEYFN